MNPLHYAVIALGLAAIAVTVYAVLSAVNGYEDDEGFHASGRHLRRRRALGGGRKSRLQSRCATLRHRIRREPVGVEIESGYGDLPFNVARKRQGGSER